MKGVWKKQGGRKKEKDGVREAGEGNKRVRNEMIEGKKESVKEGWSDSRKEKGNEGDGSRGV